MNRLRVALVAIALLFTTLTLAPAHARADSPTPNGGGVYPPGPFTVTHNGNTLTITRTGPTPDANWSCTIVAHAWKVGSLSVLAGQAYQSCSTGMKWISLRLYPEVCQGLLFGVCINPNSGYPIMGPTCLLPNAIQQWCPASGAYTRSVNPGSAWVVHVFAQASDWSGVTAGGDDYSDPVSF